MKLFFKHLIRDVSRFPIQIVLIILTLTISTCVGVGAFKTQQMFIERAHWLEDTENDLGDIILTPGASDMRMIFDSDVEALLGQNDRMFGEFRISALTKDLEGNDFIASVSGADFESADSYFEFEYTEYDIFTTENVNSSAIISKSAAEELGKTLGDTVSLSFLDHELVFTVRAIAENDGIFKESDVMIPIEALQRVLSKYVPSIAVMGKAFTPYTRIMLRLDEGADSEALLQKIHQNENLQHCGVELCTVSSTVTDMRILSQTGSIFLISSVLIILCALLCLTCLRLLEGKRRQDYALFAACGASSVQINTMRVSETLFYSLIAAAIGIPLSKNIIVWVGSLVLRPDKELTLGFDGVLFGLVMSVVLSVLCTIIHIAKLRSDSQSEHLAFEEKEKKRGLLLALVFIFVIAALFALTFVISTEEKALVCSAIIFVLVVFAVLYAPTLNKKLASSVFGLLMRGKGRLGKEALVLRAIENNYSLRHLSMIITVSVTLIISIGLCQSAATDMLSVLNGGIKYDRVVLNSDPSIAAHIKEEHDIEGLCEMRVFADAILDKTHVVFAISAYGDLDDLFGDTVKCDFPTGEKIVISKPIAKLCGVSVGDRLSFSVRGSEYSLEVANILPNKTLAVFFDAKALGIRPDMCAFNLSESESSSASVDSLREELELNGATLTTADAVFGRASKTGLAFSEIIRNSLYVSVILTAIGVVNSALSTYRRRKHEFSTLSLCGMSRTQIALRICAELFCTVLMALFISLPLIALSFVSLEIGASSFGLSLF